MNYLLGLGFISIGIFFLVCQPFVRKELSGSGSIQGGRTPCVGEVIEVHY